MPSESRRRAARRSHHVTIDLSHVDLERSGRSVLHDIDWRVEPGQRWVVFGANGAGKSQLLKLVSGSVWPTPTGRERRRYRFAGEWHDTPQDVSEEIAYIGPERQDKYERYDWNASVSRIVATGHFRTDIPLDKPDANAIANVASQLRKIGITSLARRRFLTLSYGQRRLVLIARALASRPGLLLLDELFSGLDDEFRAVVKRWLDQSSRSRLPWVLAAHRGADIPASTTHALVLDAGRIQFKGRIERAPLEKWFERADPPRPAAKQASRPLPASSARKRVLVKIEQASVYIDGTHVLRGIDLEVRAGQCWVIHGGNGSGKTTLLRTLYGDHAVAVGGAVYRRGVEPGVSIEVFKLRAGLVAPHLQTDHPLHLSVAEVVQSGMRASIGLNDPATATEKKAARAAMRLFGIENLATRTLRELSYGQMRRVLFARAQVARPDLLLLDEPFSGLDPPTRNDLRKDLDALVARGTAVVLASHHRDEWPTSVSHELELYRGRPRYHGPVR